MKELTCIVCPKGCRLQIDDENDFAVTGNACMRGVAYGKKELTTPERVLTSTVEIKNAACSRLPVRSSNPVPKQMLLDCMAQVKKVSVSAPVHRGDIILKNILNTGADIIAAKEMPAAGQ